MGLVSDAAFSAANYDRRLAILERTLKEMSSGRSLESSSIGEGGIYVVRGGSIFMSGGGGLRIEDGGGITVTESGKIRWYDNFNNLRFLISTEGTPPLTQIAYYGEAGGGVLIGEFQDGPFQYDGILVHDEDFNNIIYATGGNNLILKDTTPTGEGAFLESSNGTVSIYAGTDMYLDIGDEKDYVVYGLQETTKAANLAIAIVDDTPKLRIVSSAESLKDDLRVTDHGPTILDLGTYTWQDGDERQAGTTYEEVCRVLGDEYVTHEQTVTTPRGREQVIPPTVAYDRLFVPLLDLVKEQQVQIDALTARLNAAGL